MEDDENKINSLINYLQNWDFSDSKEVSHVSKKSFGTSISKPCFADRVSADRNNTDTNDIYPCDRSEGNEFLPPINISFSERAGRFLTTSKDIAAGEIIFWEKPLVLAPKAGSGPTCLNCFRTLPHEKWPVCSECKCPRCNNDCEGNEHNSVECDILKHVFSGIDSSVNQVKQLNIILTPLRTYIAKIKNPTIERIIEALQSNSLKRKKSSLGEFINRFIIPFFQNDHLWEVDAEFIHHACGIFDTNAFDVSLGDCRHARALLPLAALMNHSCRPNTQHWFFQGRCVVRASVPIAKGEVVTNTYTQTFWDTKTRSSHLLLTKLFTCDCPRCQDSSEFGTYLSFIRCQMCKKGLLSPTKSDPTSWKCPQCEGKMTAMSAQNLILVASNIVSRAEGMDIETMLMTLKKLWEMLGQQHYTSLKLGYVFVKKAVERICAVNDEILFEVLSITDYLLRTANKLEPGLTRIRGVLLFEKLKGMTELLSRGFHTLPNEDLNKPQQKQTKLKEILQVMTTEWDECQDILMWDSALEEVQERRQKWQSQQNILATLQEGD